MSARQDAVDHLLAEVRKPFERLCDWLAVSRPRRLAFVLVIGLWFALIAVLA